MSEVNPQGQFLQGPPQGYPQGAPIQGFPQSSLPQAYPQGPPLQGYPQGPSLQGYPQAPPLQGYPQGVLVQGYPQAPPLQGYPQGVLTQGYPQGAPVPPQSYPQGGYPQHDPKGAYLQPPQNTDTYIGHPGNAVLLPGDLGEDATAKFLDFTEQSIRRLFIRKVYSILMCQLLVTMGFIALFLFHRPTKLFVISHTWLLWAAMAVTFACIIAMSCFETARRQTPHNFIFLSVFTVAESFLLGVISSRYEVDAVLMAVGITAALCFALTMFAFQTKWDFTVLGGALVCILFVLIIFGFIKIFLPASKTLTLVYASVGALLFSVYLVYDTQLMMGGKHKYSISPEEYIFAALSLYLDVINLFLFILRIIGVARS